MKWFLIIMCFLLGFCAKFGRHIAIDDHLATIFAHLSAIALFHFVFHFWCDTEDNATMVSRYSKVEYLLIATNLYILWLCRESDSPFTKGMIILVMPVYFTREAQSVRSQALFGILHFAAVLAMFGGSVTGEPAQWLVNLIIVDFIVVDMGAARHAAEATRVSLRDTLILNESLLLTSYDATCWGSFKNTKLGLQPMIAFGTPLLSELFGWWKPMNGVILDSRIITSGLDEIRDFFVEASQTRSLPEYRRRVLASCRDARGGTFEAEFRVAPRMHGDKRGEECFFLGVRVVGEKRQSLEEPLLEGDEHSSSDGKGALASSSSSAEVGGEPPPPAPSSGTPLWSWLWGSDAQEAASRARTLDDPFDCREACWQVLARVPGLLAARCNTKSRLEVMEGTPDVLRSFPGILQRPVYELVTQERSMFMRRKLTNMLHVTEFSQALRTSAVHCEDIGIFELSGDVGHARIIAALVSAPGSSDGSEQTEAQLLVLFSREDGATESLEKQPRSASSLRYRAVPSEDGIGSATSADGLMCKAGPHMQFPNL